MFYLGRLTKSNFRSDYVFLHPHNNALYSFTINSFQSMNFRMSFKWLTILKARNWLILTAFIAVLVSGVIGYRFYNAVFHSNINRSGILYIPTGSGFEQVLDSLVRGKYLEDISSFKWVAARKHYQVRISPGAYTVKNGWNNNQLVDLLRSGNQTPVKVTINNIRFREELAGKLSKYLEPDSGAFMGVLNNDQIASEMGFTRESFPMLIIPNTYEIFWSTSPLKFIGRMKVEYDRFWNESRKKRAIEMELSPLQIVTIASIVQEETNKNDEKPRIAGVYINRLKRGWLLQADPTVKFAMGNFQIKRVLTTYLSTDSPYNTYKYAGLPPGPINFPEIVNVDAVLNAEHHNFMYFCAREDFSGYHNFAQSLAEHGRNAARYQNALNNSKIWK